MRKYIYIVLALLVFGACTKVGIDSSLDGAATSNVTVLDNGDIQITLGATIAAMDEYEVVTRADYATMEESVVDGWAFVFAAGTPGSEGAVTTTIDGVEVTYADDSELIQKVALKSGSGGAMFFTLSPYEDAPCYIRLMANVTDVTESEILTLVSQKDYAADNTKTISTLADYKNISVSLIGYYDIAYDALAAGTAIPDPNALRTKKAGFPAASPGYVFPKGITSETVEAFNEEVGGEVTMVPVGSKVTVATSATCDFELQEVYALNVAKRAMMRSTVLEDDGTSVISSYPVPTNFGGTTKTAAAVAVSGSTLTSPIYIFPNEGDDPFAEANGFAGQTDILGIQIEDQASYPVSNTVTGKNPTYLIVKGRAAGYSVDGYYKIALINSSDGYTYDVLRNGHYKVNIYDVDNAGYATAAEAEVGPSSEISYNVTIGASSDSRNIIKVSNNGLFSTEFDANKIYMQGYGTAGAEASFMVKLVDNDTESNYFTESSTATLSATDGITLATTSIVADGAENEVTFTATQSGTITFRCGDLIQEIAVYYEELGVGLSGGTLTIDDGTALFSASTAIEDFDSGYTSATDMLSSTGVVASNSGKYEDRECRAKVYISGGKGIAKVYVKQASDFDLWDNVTNNIADDSQAIIYQSTGNIYTYNGTDVESVADNDERSYTVMGNDLTVSYSGSLNNFVVTNWGSSSGFSFEASNIGTNMSGSYVEANSHLLNTGSVTITNIAGDTKTYSLSVEQYAFPYTSGTHYVASSQGTTTSSSYIAANCYWNRNTELHTFYIYNVHYTPQEYNATDGVGWQWANSCISDVTNSTSNVSTYVGCSYDGTDDSNMSTFVVSRNKTYDAGAFSTYTYAMFQVVCKNGANEQITAGVNIRVNRTASQANN